MTTSEPPASGEPLPPAEAIKKDHGRAGRDLPTAVGSAVVLVGAILLSLLFWKTAFMAIVAAAVVVAIWELHKGLGAKDIDIPEQPLMLGGVVMVVGGPTLVCASAAPDAAVAASAATTVRRCSLVRSEWSVMHRSLRHGRPGPAGQRSAVPAPPWPGSAGVSQ